MRVQAIALLDTLDKDVNTFVMRVREWYSWHFPELIKVRFPDLILPLRNCMSDLVSWILDGISARPSLPMNVLEGL